MSWFWNVICASFQSPEVQHRGISSYYDQPLTYFMAGDKMFPCKFCSIRREHLSVWGRKGQHCHFHQPGFIGVSHQHWSHWSLLSVIGNGRHMSLCPYVFTLGQHNSLQMFWFILAQAHFIPNIPGWSITLDSFDPHSSSGLPDPDIPMKRARNMWSGDTQKPWQCNQPRVVSSV